MPAGMANTATQHPLKTATKPTKKRVTSVSRDIFLFRGSIAKLVERAVPAEVVGIAHPTVITCNAVKLRVVAAYAGSQKKKQNDGIPTI